MKKGAMVMRLFMLNNLILEVTTQWRLELEENPVLGLRTPGAETSM
jgi:hypothetical protein